MKVDTKKRKIMNRKYLELQYACPKFEPGTCHMKASVLWRRRIISVQKQIQD
jgi:hypothetical protein